MIKFIIRNYKELGFFNCVKVGVKVYLASIKLKLPSKELRGVYLAIEQMMLRNKAKSI